MGELTWGTGGESAAANGLLEQALTLLGRVEHETMTPNGAARWRADYVEFLAKLIRVRMADEID